MVICMNFNEERDLRLLGIEEIIKKYLPEEEGFQKTVLSAMNYSVQAGGKRIRPMLMQETYRMFGGSGEEIEPFMAAIEMIHTSSLIHDDLPAMDGDEYRRGRLTAWKAYGEDMAILAGDGLMIFAFETAAKAAAMTGETSRVLEAIRILANKTGIYGMIGGQTADVELTEKSISEEQLDFIYRLKTGALLEASMMIGAVLAGASEEEVRQIEKIAGRVGMAFQIQDDILDVTSTTEVLGKPVNSDEKNHKTTYVTLFGLEKARQDVREISHRAIRALDSLSCQNEFLKNLIGMLITREK
jgi:geranylgeranyl diphosphate synthase type II